MNGYASHVRMWWVNWAFLVTGLADKCQKRQLCSSRLPCTEQSKDFYKGWNKIIFYKAAWSHFKVPRQYRQASKSLPHCSFQLETSPTSFCLKHWEVCYFSSPHVSIYTTSSTTFKAEEIVLLKFHIGRLILQLLIYSSGFNHSQWQSFQSIHVDLLLHL